MRWVCALLSVLAILGAEPVWAEVASEPDHLTQLIGTWSCRTAYRDPARLYVLREREAILMRQETFVGPETVNREERYVRDSGTGWRVQGGEDPSFEGRGPAWIGRDWVVDGERTDRGRRASTPEHVRYERPDDRTLRIARWSGANEKGLNDVVLCLRGGVMPDESTCVVPNLPARTLIAATPRWPFGAVRGGEVVVVVALDADSNITSARVLRAPSENLGQSALEAARGSIFRTKHLECHPTAAEYAFLVNFQGPL